MERRGGGWSGVEGPVPICRLHLYNIGRYIYGTFQYFFKKVCVGFWILMLFKYLKVLLQKVSSAKFQLSKCPRSRNLAIQMSKLGYSLAILCLFSKLCQISSFQHFHANKNFFFVFQLSFNFRE